VDGGGLEFLRGRSGNLLSRFCNGMLTIADVSKLWYATSRKEMVREEHHRSVHSRHSVLPGWELSFATFVDECLGRIITIRRSHVLQSKSYIITTLNLKIQISSIKANLNLK